jgi:type IV pilus assembly protein PilC
MKVSYTAKNYAGDIKKAEADVRDERELAAQLRADGFTLTSFESSEKAEKKEKQAGFFARFNSIPLTEKLMFTRNLSVMISSGLPLSKAVQNISVQTRNKKFKKILNNVCADIQAGNSFADGLAKYPGIFNDLFVNMVKVGEVSGNLEEVLTILALQLEKEHDLRSKVKGALTYPAVILVAMVGVGIVMLTYILPKMLSVFGDMHVELPASTKMLISISNVLRFHGILVGVTFFGLIIFIKVFLTTKAGKNTLGFLSINIPVVKNLVIKINCARFARIYSSLLKSGVSVVESLNIISHTLTNFYYQQAVSEGATKVQKGIALSKIIEESPKIFPVLVAQMVEVGEETGKTEVVLAKLADFYEEEINQLTKNMSSIIEPVLMIIIGSAVGFFAVSMLQPMYSIMDNIK